MLNATDIGEIAMIFLCFRDHLKIYHWQTHSYSRHKASDELVKIISDQMDIFLETLQGSTNIRMKIPKKNPLIKFEDQTDKSILDIMFLFKHWLNYSLPNKLGSMDNDLRNIRDEILGSVNKFHYLFTLK